MKHLLLGCSLLMQLCVMCQSKNDRQLTKQLDNLITTNFPRIAPGCSFLIVRKGEIIYDKAYGVADLELSVPMQKEMIFRLGSVTKQYTAVAILQLMEKGLLSLQDSIQRFLPDFPSKRYPVTIENLLTHTSGIVDYLALNTPEANLPFTIRKDFTPVAVIDLFKNEPLKFVPGTMYEYSNSNYFLLGAIIEKVSGKTYEQYLTENIFKPADLTHTYYDHTTQIIPGRVSGYAGHQGKFENADYISMTIPYSAGGLMSNTEDLWKWHQALYAGKLIRPETLKKATTAFKLKNDSSIEYGYGWQVKQRSDERSIEHSGTIDGFQSIEIYLPDEDIFIAALYNALNDGGDDPAYMGLTNDITAVAAGKSLTQEIHLADSVLKKYVGIYEFDPKHQAIIIFENGQLQMEAPAGGLPKSDLFAKTKTIFFLKVIPAEIEFTEDGQGTVIGMITRFKGKTDTGKKK